MKQEPSLSCLYAMYPKDSREEGSERSDGRWSACVCVCVCVCVVQEALEKGGSWRNISGVVGEEQWETTLCPLGTHTLHGGVDVEGVRVRWDGLGTVLGDHHDIVSTYCFTGVPVF